MWYKWPWETERMIRCEDEIHELPQLAPAKVYRLALLVGLILGIVILLLLM